ncbi:MAG: 50S ribosomal protein L15 [Candidatus Kerfeldbacteria bacterium]|nr:50S ribosomal protein L15 [Candidatus Kerfeldbacteria bacterium]
MITLHSLRQSQKSSRPKRVGRGNASGKGTTAGRGTKGQRARTGGRNKLIRRGMKHLIERTPKTRGFRSRRLKLHAVNLIDLQRVFPDGATITTADLHRHNLIPRSFPGAKVLGIGELKKKFTVRVEAFSASAKTAIAKAGGQATLVEPEESKKPTS